MRYESYGQCMTAYMLNATSRIGEDTPVAEVLRIANDVRAFVEGGVIDEEQLGLINQAILDKCDVEVPEWVEPTTDEGLTLQDVGDALAELSVVASATAEDLATTDDAVAELSEIVAGLVPAGE